MQMRTGGAMECAKADKGRRKTKQTPDLPRTRSASGAQRPWLKKPLDSSGRVRDADLSSTDLFEEVGLLDSITAITGKEPEAADELAFFLLIILDGLCGGGPDPVRNAQNLSVRAAFQLTHTFRA